MPSSQCSSMRGLGQSPQTRHLMSTCRPSRLSRGSICWHRALSTARHAVDSVANGGDWQFMRTSTRHKIMHDKATRRGSSNSRTKNCITSLNGYRDSSASNGRAPVYQGCPGHGQCHGAVTAVCCCFRGREHHQSQLHSDEDSDGDGATDATHHVIDSGSINHTTDGAGGGGASAMNQDGAEGAGAAGCFQGDVAAATRQGNVADDVTRAATDPHSGSPTACEIVRELEDALSEATQIRMEMDDATMRFISETSNPLPSTSPVSSDEAGTPQQSQLPAHSSQKAPTAAELRDLDHRAKKVLQQLETAESRAVAFLKSWPTTPQENAWLQ